MQVVLNGIALGSIYALVALGFALIYRVTHFADFSFAGTIVIGAFGAAFVARHAQSPWQVALATGVAIAAISGAVCEAGVYRILRRRRASDLVLVLASLGLMVVLINLVALTFGDRPQLIRLGAIKSYHFGSGRMADVRAWSVLAALLTGLVMWGCLRHTLWGIRLRAVASDRSLATAVGIDAHRLTMQAVLLGSAVGGLGATLAGFDTGITPTAGFALLLPGVLAAIMAGRTIIAALPCGFLVGIIQQVGAWCTSSAWQDVVLLIILVLVLLLKPVNRLGGNQRG